MTEFIPAATPVDPNKLPVIATVKQAFALGFAYIKAYPLYFAGYLVFMLANSVYTNMPANDLIANMFSPAQLIPTIVGLLIAALLQISTARAVLNQDGKLDFSTLFKNGNYWRIFAVGFVIFVTNLIVSWAQRLGGDNSFMIFLFGLVSLFIAFVTMRLACFNAANAVDLDRPYGVLEAFSLTKGSFWRVVGIVVLIMLPMIILNMVKGFSYITVTPPLGLSLLTALVTAVSMTCLYAAHALIFIHLTEKAHA